MKLHRTLAAAATAFLIAAPAAAPIRADDNPNKTTYLTFHESVRLPGVALLPGTNRFELPDPFGAWSVVNVSSRDRRIVYYSGLTYVVDRPSRLGSDAAVMFGEAPRGEPKPITVWFPSHESTGRQFVYR